MTPEHERKYLNLALISIGEALTEIGNQRNRRPVLGFPGDYANARLALNRAICSLQGTLYTPMPEVINVPAPPAEDVAPRETAPIAVVDEDPHLTPEELVARALGPPP